jgi:hypothetical protein
MNIKRLCVICCLGLVLIGGGLLPWNAIPSEDLLIKISRSELSEISPPARILKQLRGSSLVLISRERLARLESRGVIAQVLHRGFSGKRLYLVEAETDSGLKELSRFGHVRPIEEGIVLFWPSDPKKKEELSSRFRMVRLNGDLVNRRISGADSGRSASLRKRDSDRREDVHPGIADIVSRVSRSRIAADILALQNFMTRYASTSQCESAGRFLMQSFRALGIQADLQPFSFEGQYTSNNVIATLPGETDLDETVIICAHYDSTSRAPYVLAPGADDNASGTAAVLEAARVLAADRFDFTIKFICFSAEEWGLYGSQRYAGGVRMAGRESIIGVVNLDMISFSDSLPEDLDLIGNPDSEWLVDRFFSVAVRYVPLNLLKIINENMIWSDHSPFWDNGYSAVLGIEDQDLSNPHYHTGYDTFDTLNMNFALDAVRASVAVVADLAQPVSDPPTPAGLMCRSQTAASLFSARKTVFLTWEPSPGNGIGTNIYRTTTRHGNYEKVNADPVSGTRYSDSNLDPDTTYYYVVTAVDSLLQESNYSRESADDEGNGII